jgi:hypothetical protein
LYRTRFVLRLPLRDAGKVATHIDEVGCESGTMPNSVHISSDEETKDVVATVDYHTATSSDSDLIIGAWRNTVPGIQVERQHRINPDHFETFALTGQNGRALRHALARDVRELCVRGVGSKGILEYLEECEAIVGEMREFVQSMRAPI